MIPPEPEIAETQRASGVIHLRYEDVSQDGRVVVTALPQALGEAVWRPLLSRTPIAHALRDAGIVPILSRLHVRGGLGPISVRASLQAHGCYDMAHTVDAQGTVDRIVLRMWARVSGPKGRTHGPHPKDAGEIVHVGDVYAEHVLTRPFGPLAERKVLHLDVAGMPRVPEHRVVLDPPDALATLPSGARAYDDAPVAEARAHVFGLDDTDSNQHVNSLVYPRVLRETGVRRLATSRDASRLLACSFELAYRKPCFAGDRVVVVGRGFALEGGGGEGDGGGPAPRCGFAATMVREGDTQGRPHCYGRVLFSE